MVSNRISHQARQLMAQNPGLRYQQALDQVRSAHPARSSSPSSGMVEALGIHELESYDPRPTWRDNEWDSHFHFPLGFAGAPGSVTNELEILDCAEASVGGSGPHGCIQGVTGTGKSMLLSGMVLAAAARYSPTKVNFILMDFKGSHTFRGFENLPHCLANLSNLTNQAESVARLVDVIEGEILRREAFNTQYNVDGIVEYRELRQQNPDKYPPYPELFIIIDEFREYMESHREHQKLLSRVGTVGRAIGMHLIASSQYIDMSMIGDITEHLTFGISFMVSSGSRSRNVVKTEAAKDLPLGQGAAILYQEVGEKTTNFVGFNVNAPYGDPASGTTQRDALISCLARHHTPLTSWQQLIRDATSPTNSAPATHASDADQLPRAADARFEIDTIVGRESVKSRLHSLLTEAQVNLELRRRGQHVVDGRPHFVFTGPPGTGKSHTADVLAAVLHATGAISRTTVVHAHRALFIGDVVGRTEAKTTELFNSARGGVLFVDNAPELISASGGGSDFGRNAVSTLGQLLRDSEQPHTAVILSGSPEPMRQFLAGQPHFAGMFNHHIAFPSLDAAELARYLRFFAERQGRTIVPSLDHDIEHICAQICPSPGDHETIDLLGNIRFAQATIDRADTVAVSRISTGTDLSTLTDEQLLELTAADVAAAVQDICAQHAVPFNPVTNSARR